MRCFRGLIVVTGGAGFVGWHVSRLLASLGYEVLVVDDFSSGDPRRVEGLRGTSLVRADVSRWGDVEGLLGAARGAEAVVHLAAVVSVDEASLDPLRTVMVNVAGTANMLELSRRVDSDAFILASSAAVYGEPRYLPIDEAHPLEPVNIYGESKLMAERLLWGYNREYGIRAVALRIFNAYGPGMRPGPYSGVVYRFIESLLRGERPVIHGDGSQTRDFVYVGDVARAFALSIESSYSGPLNVGSGAETSIRRLYEEICSIVGRCPSPAHAPPRRGDVARSRADISRAREAISWRPEKGLREGLEETVEYYRRVSVCP